MLQGRIFVFLSSSWLFLNICSLRVGGGQHVIVLKEARA